MQQSKTMKDMRKLEDKFKFKDSNSLHWDAPEILAWLGLIVIFCVEISQWQNHQNNAQTYST